MNAITDTTPNGAGNHLPVIAGVEIATDKHGRFNLNALHRASGEGDHKAPNQWLRLTSTKALVTALQAQTADLQFGGQSGNSHFGLIHTTRGGNAPGTFADELLAVDYAGWISPEFRLDVHRVFIAYRKGALLPAPVPGETLEQIERSFGIIRAVMHKVTELEKAMPGIVTSLVEPLVAARLAEQRLLLRAGKTANDIWLAAGLPSGIKGASTWFGNRLAEMGCLAGGGMRADRGSGSIRLFDPDQAAICLRNGLVHRCRTYVDERRGQKRLHLVPPARPA